jgi:hypothetical protein
MKAPIVGMIGIVPITIFSGTWAEADNPRLFADTDTVSSVTAVLSASRRDGQYGFTAFLPARNLALVIALGERVHLDLRAKLLDATEP